MKTKICKKCKKEKSLDKFIKNKNCKDGCAGTCKDCSNLYCTAWKRKNSERIGAERRRRYAETKGAEVKKREIKRRKKHPIRYRAQRLRANMRDRGKKGEIDWDNDYFTVEKIMQIIDETTNCPCCGRIIEYSFSKTGLKEKEEKNSRPSFDRMIPRKGYTKENTRLICWRCNNLKRDATPDELLRIANWMLDNGWGNEVDGIELA